MVARNSKAAPHIRALTFNTISFFKLLVLDGTLKSLVRFHIQFTKTRIPQLLLYNNILRPIKQAKSVFFLAFFLFFLSTL